VVIVPVIVTELVTIAKKYEHFQQWNLGAYTTYFSILRQQRSQVSLMQDLLPLNRAKLENIIQFNGRVKNTLRDKNLLQRRDPNAKK